jgi:hypothetical protein
MKHGLGIINLMVRPCDILRNNSVVWDTPAAMFTLSWTRVEWLKLKPLQCIHRQIYFNNNGGRESRWFCGHFTRFIFCVTLTKQFLYRLRWHFNLNSERCCWFPWSITPTLLSYMWLPFSWLCVKNFMLFWQYFN